MGKGRSEGLQFRLFFLLDDTFGVHVYLSTGNVKISSVASKRERNRPLRFTHASTEIPAKTMPAPAHWPSVSLWL